MTQEWIISSAKATGTSHTRSGTPCQDAYAYKLLDSHGVLLFAVSDGAGSAKHSEHGSTVAVETACAYLASCIDRGRKLEPALLQEAMEHALKALKALIWKKWLSGKIWKLHDLACTLTLAAAGDDCMVVAQIGDGAVVVREDAQLRCITEPDRGEYANETRFLTSKNAVFQPYTLVIKTSSGLDAIAVMTDGIEGISIDKNQVPFYGFFEPILAYLTKHMAKADSERNPALQSLLESSKINDLTDDDKTLLIALRMAV